MLEFMFWDDFYLCLNVYRPTVWMDYEEVREVLCSWDGYKILLLQLQDTEDLYNSSRQILRQCKPTLEQWISSQSDSM